MKQYFIFVAFVLIALSCSKQEDPIELEKKEMKAFFDNSHILVPYKGVKIALRTDYSDQSAKQLKISETGMKTLSTISTYLIRDSMPAGLTGLYDTYQQVKALYELKKEINAINEDELPTIFKRLSTMESGISGASNLSAAIEKEVFGNYNNSTEHFLLGSIWFITPSAPADMYVYEAAQINESEIEKADQHAFAALLKALVCAEKNWNYYSEKSATGYLDYVATHKAEVMEATKYLDSIPGTEPEQRFYELHCLGYALRGYARENSERPEEAEQDYKAFISDFEKSGLHNKQLCYVAAYMCIRYAIPGKADTFLKHIETEGKQTGADKKTIAELRNFIKAKNGEAFSKFMDSFPMSKIAFGYLYELSVNSDMARKLRKNNATEIMVSMPQRLNQAMNATKNALNTDSLLNSAGKLLDGILK